MLEFKQKSHAARNFASEVFGVQCSVFGKEDGLARSTVFLFFPEHRTPNTEHTIL